MHDEDGIGSDESLDIAIIGMAGRFPGVRNVAAFWEQLHAGAEAISRFSAEELAAAGIPPEMQQLPNFVPAGTQLEDIEWFDATFFGYSPREAEAIDPQQRVFLECAWEALEHAGYDPGVYSGPIGVFGGASLNTYLLNHVLGQHSSGIASDYFQVMMGSDKDFLTTRVSYKLGLRGPSLGVQTACSTSLLAGHLACQSLLSYQSDMVLAGGVSISVPQAQGYLYQEGGVFSSDGRCRAFDADASGTVKGNGVGIVVLKRLVDALADGDTIHALIKGSAINNDGAHKIGYTAPSQDGQAEVIGAALAVADISPETIGYIEAHGTATPLGDPIEVAALSQVFRAATPRAGFCALGSVKTNVGHLDAAAGVTGLIKAALALKHGVIPPSLHFRQPNPALDLPRSPFYVNREPRSWPADLSPRRAGVSAFGIGGTNAHVVLEEPPPAAPSDSDDAYQLVLLSARTETALEQAAQHLGAHLSAHPDLACADLAHTTQVGRRHFLHRRAVVCRDANEARRVLEGGDPASLLSGVAPATPRSVVFLFPGGGTQHRGMGAGLYAREPIFRAEIDRCADLLRSHLAIDLRQVLYGDTALDLERPSLALPALFATEYALAKLWMAWGVQPAAMIGHSLGEYVAACLAGVLALEDALALVALRGQLFEQLPQGGMLSVALDEEHVRPLLAPELGVAAINGPNQCVVAGPLEAIEQLEAQLQAQQVKARRLPIAVAAHSPQLEPILQAFASFVRTVTLRRPTLRYISNVTGGWADPDEVTQPEYWVRHLRQTVRFSQGVATLLAGGPAIGVEVGPGQTLTTLMRLQPGYTDAHLLLPTLRHPQQIRDDRAVLLAAAGRLWLAGVALDWPQLHAGYRRRRVPLPTYPFERQRYWIERAAPAHSHAAPPAPAAPAGATVPSWSQALIAAPADIRQTRWLIMRDQRGLGDQLAERLSSAACSVAVADALDCSMRFEDGSYMVDPSDPESIYALLDSVTAYDRPVTHVLHLWGVDDQPGAAAVGLELLLQALNAVQPDVAVDITVVSCAAQAVTGDEALEPESTALLAVCEAAATLYPSARLRAVDVSRQQVEPTLHPVLADLLLAEACSTTYDATVAYRGRHRWVCRRVPLAPVPLPLQPGGSYAVLDGASDAGLLIARDLARQVQAQLIVLEPADFPTIETWDAWLAAHAPDEPTAHKIRALQALIAEGQPLLILHVDASDEWQLRRRLEWAHAEFGPLHGVIHAGLAESLAALPRLEPLEPPLDIVASATSALAAIERVLYDTAATFCAVLADDAPAGQQLTTDELLLRRAAIAFAQRHNQHSADHWLCVSWDGWAVCALDPISGGAPPEAEDALAALWHGVAQLDAVEVSIAPRPPADAPQGRNAAPKSAQAGGHYPRPALPTAYVAPRSSAECAIAEVWSAVLGVAPVGLHDNFFELRGDSLLALQVVARLQEQLGLEIPMRSLFETPTVAELAALAELPIAPSAPDSLVRLQASDSQRPLFCVHPGGGTGLCYAELARLLGPDQPFYAIQARGLDGQAEPRSSVAEMAQAYILDVRAVQADGPYRLAGWSMGGSIAFEMARLLHAEGAEVELVALFDTPAIPSGVAPHEIDDVTLAASMLEADLTPVPDHGAQHDSEARLGALLGRLHAARILPPACGLEQFRHIIHTFRTHAQAWWDYRPQLYDGRVVVLKAAESLDRSEDPALGWGAFVARPVEARQVPGSHQTLLQPPHVAALAAALSVCLAAAEHATCGERVNG